MSPLTQILIVDKRNQLLAKWINKTTATKKTEYIIRLFVCLSVCVFFLGFFFFCFVSFFHLDVLENGKNILSFDSVLVIAWLFFLWKQVSWALLSILVDFNYDVSWIVSIPTLISKSSTSNTNLLVTVPSAPITTGITVTFIFHGYFISLAISI